MTQQIPRIPNEKELQELTRYINEDIDDPETAEGIISSASIAVFDHFISDSPGYAGKVMAVIWPGGPELHQVYVWRNGTMSPQDVDCGMGG